MATPKTNVESAFDLYAGMTPGERNDFMLMIHGFNRRDNMVPTPANPPPPPAAGKSHKKKPPAPAVAPEALL